MLCRTRWLLFHLSAHSLQPCINLIITLSVLLQKLSQISLSAALSGIQTLVQSMYKQAS